MADGYDEDFEEEEVCAVMTSEMKGAMSTPKPKRPNHHKDSSSSSSSSSSTGTRSGSRRISSGARMIPIRSNASPEAISARRSIALSIPDRSKTHRHGKGRGSESHENEDEDDDARAPPHEWLSKKMARSQISSPSVCEGAGRTLKGRDLSKVRNAVLTRTGFLE